MDPDRAKRRQSLKIIISETIMFASVVITVIILAFLVSGYWINSDFKVERQGLLQISSVPTGADVDIDGDSSWFQRTNTSKVLSSGEHTVTLTKDGYDSWSKTINISEGLLYRIHYPRLFLQDTVAEDMLDISGSTRASFSPDGSQLLLLSTSLSWQLIDLENTELTPVAIEISGLFSNVDSSPLDPASLNILSLDWDQDNRHILISAQHDGTTEWVLLDAHNIDRSVNLTKEFKNNFSEVQILDHSANNLLAVMNNSLYKIDVSGRILSPALVQNVTSFNHYDTNEIIFSALDDTRPDSQSSYYVGILKPNNDEIIRVLDTASPVHAVISKFYDDKYITVLQDNLLTLYKYQDFDKISDYELTFSPDMIKVGHNGEFITMHSGDKIATLDMETESITEWNVDSTTFGWIDNDMIYAVNEAGEIIVYDFDGLNRRIIARGADASFPTKITADKWLYFFDDGKLMRQVIAD